MAKRTPIETKEVSAKDLRKGDRIIHGTGRVSYQDDVVVLDADPFTETRMVSVPGTDVKFSTSVLWLVSSPAGGNPYRPGKPLYLEHVDSGNGGTLVRVPA